MCLLSAMACGDAAVLPSRMDDPSPPDAKPTVITRIREDFINQELVEAQNGVVLDFNRGLVTLPTQVFPSIDGSPVMAYATSVEENGVVSAEQILVQDTAVLKASDAIELLARDFLRVTGRIQAGRGGITLAAGRRIIIDGVIESEGPVRVLLGDETGTIEISGTLATIATTAGPPPNTVITGRGRVQVFGQISSNAERGLSSGDITIDSYGKIEVIGFRARLSQNATGGGSIGAIRLTSESEILIHDGARIDGEDPSYEASRTGVGAAGAGDIELQARAISIGDDSRITALSTRSGQGGTIRIAAGSTLTSQPFTSVTAGSGRIGGSLFVEADRVDLGEGSVLVGGSGTAGAGIVRVESSDSLHVGSGAMIVGGDGACAAGGDVNLLVGGLFSVESGGAVLGGSGGLTFSSASCRELHRGGNVDIIARKASGISGAISGGAGATSGSVNVVIDPTYDLAPPNLTVASSGWIESKVLDRGAAAIGKVPELIDIEYTAPLGTSVVVGLAGSERPAGPFDAWVDVDHPGASPFETLAEYRYFRYRVVLQGRALDTPVLDFFDIDLAPKN